MIVIRQVFQEKKIVFEFQHFGGFFTIFGQLYQQAFFVNCTFFMCFNNNCTILLKNLIEQKKKKRCGKYGYKNILLSKKLKNKKSDKQQVQKDNIIF